MKRFIAASLLAFAAPAVARQLTIADVTMLSRVGAPAVSKDGRWMAWAQRETDLAADRGRYDIWRLDLTKRGAKPEKILGDAEVNENDPQIVGDTLYFSSDKGGDDAIWAMPITGGTPRKLTGFQGGFGGFKVAPTGDRIVVWADRKPGAPSLAPALEKKDPNAGAGRTYDQLFVRHWDKWADGNRSQLFVLPLTAAGAPGDGVAVERGLVGDAPSKPFGGGEEVAWSPDGRTLYFALREAGRIEALSTNLDIFAVPADGSAAPVNLTDANDATDTLPAASPDGRTLAWVAMKRPGYEADRQVLMLRDIATGQVRALTESWDRSVAGVFWAPDGKSLYITADDTQEVPLFRVDAATGKVTRLTQQGHVSAVATTPKGVVYALNSLTAPDDFWALAGPNLKSGGRPARLTTVNADRLAGIDWPTVTRFNFPGANGDTVWAMPFVPRARQPRCRSPTWSTAARRDRATTAGPTAGTRRCSRARAMAWSRSISTAVRVTARRSPTRSRAIGAVGRWRTCKRG